MNKIRVQTMFKTIDVEQADGSLVLYPYIAVDTKRKWYLHEGLFAGTYAIHNYENNQLICGISKNGDLRNIGKINVSDLDGIKKLYSQMK